MNQDQKSEIDNISKQLLESGWQSWSTKPKRTLHFLHRNYSPKDDKTLIELSDYIPKEKIRGWCSWYAFGSKINENKILGQAEFISDHKDTLPLDYILIDDGWTEWGDWDRINNDKFPSGFSFLTKSLAKLKFKSGIWIAPFLISPKSQICKNHKNWLVTDERGKSVEGFKLIHPTIDRLLPYKKYILDLKNPEVQNYLKQSIDNLIKNNNFNLLKLDYLYAPYFDPNLSAEEASDLIRELLKYVRLTYPHIHIIGCGLPLIPAVGYVDSMRIGPDIIIPHFDKIPILSRLINTQKVHGAIKVLRKRNWTSRFWIIDPDVFVCRKSLHLSHGLLIKLQKEIKNTKGNVFLGDDLTKLPENRIKTYISPLFE